MTSTVNPATSSSNRISLQMNLTIIVVVYIAILEYNRTLLRLPADIHSGLVSPLWFWTLQFFYQEKWTLV